MRGGGHLCDPGFEIFPPVGRREEHALFVGHIAPDHEAVQQAAARRDLSLRHRDVIGAEAVDDLAHLVGVFAHPHQRVLLTDEPREAFARLDHAAIDREVGPQGAHRVDPRRGVALKAVADAGDLVVTRAEEAPRIVGRIEDRLLEFFKRVGFPGAHLGHRQGEVLAHDRAEARLDRHLLRRLLQRRERPDPRVHVRDRDDPIEVVVIIGIGVSGESEVRLPALGEAAPEEIADGHAIGLLVVEGPVHALEFAPRVFLARGLVHAAADGVEHAHGEGREARSCARPGETGYGAERRARQPGEWAVRRLPGGVIGCCSRATGGGIEPLMDFANGRNLRSAAPADRRRGWLGGPLIAGCLGDSVVGRGFRSPPSRPPTLESNPSLSRNLSFPLALRLA